MKPLKHLAVISFIGLLTLVFIVLKATDSITWEWVWVLCPLWIAYSVSVLLAPFAIGMQLQQIAQERNAKAATEDFRQRLNQQSGIYKSKWEERMREAQKKGDNQSNY